MKQTTRYYYQRFIDHKEFSEWKNKPLVSITKADVSKIHANICETSGKAHANYAMRVLRAIFNFISNKHEDYQGNSFIKENPVKGLSKLRSWYRIPKRKTYVKSHQLADWYNAVITLENEVIRDYLIFVLFTGLRRNEAAEIKKSEVDLKSRTCRINDTKNHEPHELPLTDYLYDLVKNRIELSPNQYVFPAPSAKGRVAEPRKQMNKVIKKTGISFTLHDLRRTFITIEESLDIAAYSLKRLMYHKVSDITSDYIITDVERLRVPMQKITNYILANVLAEDIFNILWNMHY